MLQKEWEWWAETWCTVSDQVCSLEICLVRGFTGNPPLTTGDKGVLRILLPFIGEESVRLKIQWVTLFFQYFLHSFTLFAKNAILGGRIMNRQILVSTDAMVNAQSDISNMFDRGKKRDLSWLTPSLLFKIYVETGEQQETLWWWSVSFRTEE